MRQPIDTIDAKVLWFVEFRTIAQDVSSRFPAAPVVTARKRPDSMNELVVGISLPMGRFATASDDNTRAVRRGTPFGLDRRSQVHQASYPAKDALRVINQSHQLPERRLPAEIEHTLELWMKVTGCSDLNKQDSSAKVINYLLV